jgi:hypothetical protein
MTRRRGFRSHPPCVTPCERGSVIAFPALDTQARFVRALLLMTRTLAGNRCASAPVSPLFSPEKQGKNRIRADLSAANIFVIKHLRPSAGRSEDALTGEV